MGSRKFALTIFLAGWGADKVSVLKETMGSRKFALTIFFSGRGADKASVLEEHISFSPQCRQSIMMVPARQR